MRKHNPFARLPTSPSKRILMLAPVAVGSGSSRLYHRLPIAAGLTGKNPSTMDHHEMTTRMAPLGNSRQIHTLRWLSALEPPVGAWWHVPTSGRYLSWVQPTRHNVLWFTPQRSSHQQPLWPPSAEVSKKPIIYLTTKIRLAMHDLNKNALFIFLED